MSKSLRKICIIPARGGSKRIKKKNIKNFCGKPIIAFSIQAAIKSKCFDRIIVSTEDKEIAKVAIKYSAEVPFLRPKSLAGDLTHTLPVINHAIKELTKMKQKPDIVCCITATAPLIEYKDIQKGLKILLNTNKKFVFPVTSFAYPIQRALIFDKNNNISMMFPKNKNKRSQDLKATYQDAGQFYWGKTKAFLQNLNVLSNFSKAIVLPRFRVIDIDTLEDWHQAELIFRAKKFNQNIKG